MAAEWRNWSGSVRTAPRELTRPRTVAELSAIVARSQQLRVTGAGHSFMPLCETGGTLLDLSALEGEIEVAADRRTAWVPAGLSLRKLTPALWDRGLSLFNQGDVDPQSLAGALATGTHGTGRDLGCLSTAARAYRLMLADGSVVECSESERPELFQAQRLALGLLGVALSIRIDVLPAYRLEERTFVMPLDQVAEQFDALATRHRHVEFFVFPYSDRAIVKTLHPTEDSAPYRAPSALDELLFKTYCEAATRVPTATGVLQKALVLGVRASRRVGPAHSIFATERTVRFEEMEYELPREAGFVALREVIAWLRARSLPVTFPFEFRWTAGDDIWLSPFNRGPCASVSMHQFFKLPWRELFSAAEPIFRAHGGRPHWAKRHTLTARDVRELYPQAGNFCRVRAAVDPTAKFANRLTTELFQIEPAARSHTHAG